jgi:hypothetical protein
LLTFGFSFPRPPLEDIVLPGRHLLVEAEAGLFDVSETASEAWSTDVVTSDTERMAEVDTDETSSVARSEADSEQDSTTSMLAVNAGSSHLGAIQQPIPSNTRSKCGTASKFKPSVTLSTPARIFFQRFQRPNVIFLFILQQSWQYS